MKKFAGIDIGSRTIELVVVDTSGQIVEALQADTGFDPMTEAQKMVGQVSFDGIVATGYGRNLFEVAYDARTVTEIKAHALGARYFFPKVTAVLDIGGQDSKAISLFPNGKVKKFEMNDRCAAGTGKFMEIMARTLGFELGEFGSQALKSQKELQISSMCTVFAESEVTSLIAKGHSPEDIAMGLHRSNATRVGGMLRRVGAEGNVAFTGGVAYNPCMKVLLEKQLGVKVLVPENPQLVGALGAALLAGDEA